MPPEGALQGWSRRSREEITSDFSASPMMRARSLVANDGPHSPERVRLVSQDNSVSDVNPERVVRLSVSGMTSSACSSAVEKGLKKLPGVVRVQVALLAETAEVQFVDGTQSVPGIVRVIEKMGFVAATLEDVEAAAKTRGGQRVRLSIQGMTCSACSGAVENTLRGVPGVFRVAVSLTTGDAIVELEPDATVDAQALVREVVDAGFEASEERDAEMSSVKLLVEGMTCAACTGAVENALRGVPGVEDISVALLPEGHAEIRFDPDRTGPRAFVETIEDAGFEAMVSSSERSGTRRSSAETEAERYRSLFWTSLSYTVPTFAINMILPHLGVFSWLYVRVFQKVSLASFLKWALATPVQFTIGSRFHRGAYKSLRNGTANMDVLVSLATNVAYFTSIYLIFHCILTGHNFGRDFFETSTMLITFILLGKYLESIAKGQTSEAISKLMDLTPNTAVLLKPVSNFDPQHPVYKEEIISSKLIHRGDVLKVLPGSRVAADGVLVEGDNVHVDESMITGEALPVLKKVGDDVVGGTLNSGSAFNMRAVRVGADASLSQIVKLVENAQLAKAPIQAFADRISSVFVPFVVAVATMTWLAWYVAGEDTSILVAARGDKDDLRYVFGLGARDGVSVCSRSRDTHRGDGGDGRRRLKRNTHQGADSLERGHVTIMAFDKTGTLTEGNPTVVDHRIFSDAVAEAQFLRVVAAAESQSEHPIGRAIARFARSRLIALGHGEQETLDLPKVNEVDIVPGEGLRCRVDGTQVVMGNKKLLDEAEIHLPKDVVSYMGMLQRDARTCVLVSMNREVIGSLAITDPIRPEAAGVVAALSRMGVQSHLVTGDNWQTARAIAAECGIVSVHAEVSPAGKAAKIEELKAPPVKKTLSGTVKVAHSSTPVVAMVGDGINDAPALAASDVGIAIGAGTDIAMEAADFVLMRSDLEDVVAAVDLSRVTFRQIRLNYIWAMVYNLLAIPLAAGVLYPRTHIQAPPWVAGAAMAFSSVSVVCSSLSLRYYTRPMPVMRAIRTVADTELAEIR